MHNTIVLAIAIVALALSLVGLLSGYSGRYQIAADGTIVYRVDTANGKLTAYVVHSKPKVDDQGRFVVEIAATPN